MAGAGEPPLFAAAHLPHPSFILRNGMLFFETSAKTAAGVAAVFEGAAAAVLDAAAANGDSVATPAAA